MKEGSTKVNSLLNTLKRCLLFPAFSKLLVQGLVLLIATADCDRGFSAMKRIKTVHRLRTNSLEQLIFISINGPSAYRFYFGRAADKWGALHHHRIHWQDWLLTCSRDVCCCISQLYFTSWFIFGVNIDHWYLKYANNIHSLGWVSAGLRICQNWSQAI